MNSLEFYNREKETEALKKIIMNRPDLIYFLYGPINSGKTSLIVKVLSELSREYLPFYINLRRRNIGDINDFFNTLFRIDRKSSIETAKEYVRELSKEGAHILKEIAGIPLPKKIFDYIFKEKEKVEDIFEYLEDFFNSLGKEGFTPILVIDELQIVKGITNTKGMSVLENLFNFMVGLTKEIHLCHCFAITSDSLFIEDIYGNARLEGRSENFLVDDLDKSRAVEIYDRFGFKDKESVWNYIGGKPGDMIRLEAKMRLGVEENEAISMMVASDKHRIKYLLEKAEEGFINTYYKDNQFNLEKNKILEILKLFIEDSEVLSENIPMIYRNYLIDQNFLFLDPATGMIRPQSRLIKMAIEKVVKDHGGK